MSQETKSQDMKLSPDEEAKQHVEAAIALLDRMNADGKLSLSEQARGHIASLAEEAKRLNIWVISDVLNDWIGAKNAKAFNEMRSGNGKTREAYKKVVDILSGIMKDSTERVDTFPQVSLKEFKCDNSLYHIPRMLTTKETDMLVRGIGQRAQALRHFVIDMHSAGSAEAIKCIKDGALPQAVFERVSLRAGETSRWDHDVSKLYWSTWYGPDIIRGPDGKFYVLEDNLGYVGGFGDLIEARRILLKQFKELEPAIGNDRTADFYQEMADHYRAQVAPGEKVVVLYYVRRGSAGQSECSDNEDRRMMQLLVKFGKGQIVGVPIPGPEGPRKDRPYLEVRNKKTVTLVIPEKEKKQDESKDSKGDQGKRNASPARDAKRNASPVPKRDGAGRSSGTGKRALSPTKERAPSPAKVTKTGQGKKTDKPNPSPSPTRAASPARKIQKVQREQPVGLVILLSEAENVDAGHQTTRVRAVMEEASNRISEYQEMSQEKLKEEDRFKSIIKVTAQVDFIDSDKDPHSFLMEKKTLVWIAYNKAKPTEEMGRCSGPFFWDSSKMLLSSMSTGTDGSQWEMRVRKEEIAKLESKWILDENPARKMLEKEKELKAALEQVILWKAPDAGAEDGNTEADAVNSAMVGGAEKDALQILTKLLNRDDRERLKKMSRRGIPHLMDAYYSGGVRVANGPGFEFLGDKELCAHMDSLIKYYLKEDPILMTAPTRSFAVESNLIHAVFDNASMQENVVVKRVDGRGGEGVWVGAKICRSDFMAARALVEAEPDAFIVQKYLALSQVNCQLVDLRGPAFITSDSVKLSGGEGVSVSPVLWGRGVPEKGGNGKVNISDKGFEFVICTSPSEAEIKKAEAEAKKAAEAEAKKEGDSKKDDADTKKKDS